VTEWFLLALAVVLIGANAVFVAAEFSFITVQRASVEQLAERGDRRAQSLLAALKRLSTQLSGAQLGITATSLVVGYLAEPSLARLLRVPLETAGLGGRTVTAVAVTVAMLLATGSQMVFGELVPKNWAIAEPMRVGRRVAGVQRTFTRATRWLIHLLNGAANLVLRLLRIEPTEELASARSPDELSSLARRSSEEGTLDERTAMLVSRSVGLADRHAHDAMTPRPRVTFLDAGQRVSDVLETTSRTGHARFPVTGDSVDDVQGFVHFKHALAVPREERAGRTVGDVMVPVAQVPDSMDLDDVLETLRSGLQMAVVVDEYGGTAGIITLEDLVEEIVGEIEDEQDRAATSHFQRADGSWVMSGLLRPDEASELLGLQLPESDEADTLGGLLVERLGRMPEVDDTVTIEARDIENPDEDGVHPTVVVELTVGRLDGSRVDRVRLQRAEEPQPESDSGAESGSGSAAGSGQGAQPAREKEQAHE
jgi:CBS domain containing-hemolysin-like protein